ncbi:MAG TPA: prepilin-type N-terminal cleavage/methylation domain-containing protein [Phycisphaerae bacterium]|nr:prepilin-type N-terminal cleavage/methylation domain-containing protein [Phycisphaerae bacterium]
MSARRRFVLTDLPPDRTGSASSSRMRRRLPAPRQQNRPAFTLIELLVVISIIMTLISILTPSLAKAKWLARNVKCLSQVRGQLTGVHMYATDHAGQLICGSDNPLKYPGQGTLPAINTLASFQIWLGLNQEYSSLAELTEGGYMPWGMLFCPNDDDADMEDEYEKLRTRSGENAWGSYLYRQLDGQSADPPRRKIEGLGTNTAGQPIKALIVDMQCTMEWTGLPTKSNHGGKDLSLGLVDGSTKRVDNVSDRLTLNGATGDTFKRLDQILEHADELGR